MRSISLRRAAVMLLAVVLSLTAVACDWDALTPEQQASITAHLQRRSAPASDCNAAIDKHWPASSAGWAKSIVKRESGNTPTAKNPASTASGCFQLLQMHAHRIPGGWANRFDAESNTLGALSLYREAGTSPWAL
jgi:hypothetical protein